eukprot:57171-Hanusia_phi.AAC.1
MERLTRVFCFQVSQFLLRERRRVGEGRRQDRKHVGHQRVSLSRSTRKNKTDVGAKKLSDRHSFTANG